MVAGEWTNAKVLAHEGQCNDTIRVEGGVPADGAGDVGGGERGWRCPCSGKARQGTRWLD